MMLSFLAASTSASAQQPTRGWPSEDVALPFAEPAVHAMAYDSGRWEELRSNVKEAVGAFYFDSARPPQVRLHLVRDEVLALG
ncbi:MAG TPA: hypothetical protein VNB06_02905 [Thermoanaerobaculia bacterium]|nr:hypothetical protein [Thermoanaerobaculia bacterium]